MLVIRDQKASFSYHLVFSEGDLVKVGKEDNDMPGWYWCMGKSGDWAWIPSEYLKLDGETAVLLTNYDSLELDIIKGDVLEYVTEVKYWTLCRKTDGVEGWVRNENLERIE